SCPLSSLTLLLPPPTPTLFPYTTLFRSGDHGRLGAGGSQLETIERKAALAQVLPDAEVVEYPQRIALQSDARPRGVELGSSFVQGDLDAGFGQTDGAGQAGDSCSDNGHTFNGADHD